MTDFPISDTAKPMGRPPLNLKQTPVRLPAKDLERIDALEGPNRRAAFIRNAVAEELDRRETQSDNPVQTGGANGENE